MDQICLCCSKVNKRTNGPVNAHLRTGIYKIGQGHPKVMIYINFVELLSLMLHAKFQNHRPSGSGEEDFKGFFAIYAILLWWPSWSCDLDHLYKLSFSLPKNTQQDVWF